MKKITLNHNEKKKDEDNIDYIKTNKDNIMNISLLNYILFIFMKIINNYLFF